MSRLRSERDAGRGVVVRAARSCRTPDEASSAKHAPRDAAPAGAQGARPQAAARSRGSREAPAPRFTPHARNGGSLFGGARLAWPALGLALVAASGAACIGVVGDGGGETEPPAGEEGPPAEPLSCVPDAIRPGPSPIRRMTRFEYDNTVRDLFGDTTHPASAFPAEEEALGFDNNAFALVTSSTLAEKYMLAAEGISERATDPLSKNVPCDPATVGEDACAKQFIATFGKRAFRRPLTPEESSALFGVYQAGRAIEDFRLGIRAVIETALQSPQFLYRVEFGAEPIAPGEPVVRLTPWEMASRLSYFLWGSMPDDELFAAAEAGELVTKEQIAAQARRMLDDPRAHEAAGHFHRQWLDYDRVASVGKDAALFPEWSPAIAALLRDEAEAFFDHVTFDDEQGTLGTLLTAPYAFVDDELAAFYGIEIEPGPGLRKVETGQRAGLLSLGALLAANAHSNQTSPVHRGKLVREQLLCDVMPPPPPGAVIEVPEPDPDSTARERFAEHSKNPACSSCHSLMDPIGFGFESYDAVGRYRTTEDGEPIDASGVLTESDVDGEFVGLAELAAKLAASDDVRRCYVKQWFRYAHGRGEFGDDACTIDGLVASFAATGGTIEELLVALTQTDAFLYRRAGGEEP